MSSARHRGLRFSWQLAAVLLTGGALVGACGSNRLNDGGGNSSGGHGDASVVCSDGHEGCPCSSPGQQVSCGQIKETYGTYVTCVEGTSTCSGGAWGACQSNATVVAQSLGGVTLGGNGIKVLTVTGACTDPCDPNCIQNTDGPGDVPDGSPVLITEAGVTIPPTTTQGGGGGDGAACTGLGCQVDWACAANSQTTLTGKVYDPAGVNPLYDAYVYIPIDPDPTHLPPFTAGVTCDTCAGAGNLAAVAVAQTDPTGSFTLTNVPTQQYGPGQPIPLVIQMGKWRRVTMLPSQTPCTSAAVPAANSRLPRNQTDGYNSHADLPQVAFVSGSADPFECMLLKAGIDPAEFGSSSKNSGRRFHYYNSPDSPGDSIDPAYGNIVTGDKLWNNNNAPWNLSAYDVVILACEGGEFNITDRTTSGYSNLVNYAGTGGRVFLTHFSYVWMKYNTPWIGVVNSWGGTSANATEDPLNATIVTTGFPKGQAFQTWLGNSPAPNALSGGTLPLHEARQDFSTPLAATVQPWMTATNTASGAFGGGVCSSATCVTGGDCNTGTCNGGAAGTCLVAQSPGVACFTNASCSAGNSCIGAVLGTCYNGASCTQSSDCGSGHTCHNASTGLCGKSGGPSCTHNGDCTSNVCQGASLGICTCNSGSDCSGSGNSCQSQFTPSFTFNAPISAAPANQCGRVVFSDFHVSASAQISTSGVVSCTSDANCGYGSTCAGSGGVLGQCTSLSCDPDQSVSTQCGDSHYSCSGGTGAKCGCNTTADCAAMSAGSCVGNTLGSCSTANCATGATCTSGTCNGAGAGKCGCYENSDCVTMGAGATCSGAAAGACSTKTCYQNGDCLNGYACTGGKLGTCKTGGAACDPLSPIPCANLSTCQSSTKGTCGCGETADCPSGSCGGQTAGTCVNATCFASSGCSTGPKKCNSVTLGKCTCGSNSDCSGGGNTCSGNSPGQCGTATCYGNADCSSGTGVCSGSYQDGTCAANTCTTNGNCSAFNWYDSHGHYIASGQEQCTGGNCNGCYSLWDCPGAGAGATCAGGAASGTCTGGGLSFPGECIQEGLSAQESALEFEFFDLSACVAPDNQPPPGPPTPVTVYNPATFTVDFQSSCPLGSVVKWRELDWQATIPATASIVFSAQTADATADGGIPSYSGVQSVLLATATATTPNLPTGWSTAIIDTSNVTNGGGTGLFNTASPAVTSKADLRITITLNPTTDQSAAPTLSQWQVKSDCIAAE